MVNLHKASMLASVSHPAMTATMPKHDDAVVRIWLDRMVAAIEAEHHKLKAAG